MYQKGVSEGSYSVKDIVLEKNILMQFVRKKLEVL